MGGIADVGSPLVGVSILPTEGATTTEKGTGRLGTFWTETRKEIRHDLKSTRWRHSAATYFTWLLFGLWLALLLLLSICVPLYTVGRGSFSAGVWSYCGPNGSFSLLPTNPWNIEWTFQIITGWGPLSFTEAKIIDLAWDIGVGRLGQTVLIYCSWKAFSVHVRLSMEHQPITYRTFWTIFMQREVTFRSFVRMLRDFTSRRGLRSKVAMIFIIVTMIFLMAFPTLVSAMTGYTGYSEAVVKLDDGFQVPFSDFEQFYYIVHDGDRANLTTEYKVFSQFDACHYETCVHDYIGNFGTNKDHYSIWGSLMHEGQITLDSPTLNITIYNGKTNNESFVYQPDGSVYDLYYITENAVCQPVMSNSQQVYQWGFSLIQAEFTLVLLTLWTFGVWIMWLSAHLRLASRAEHEVPQDLKAALFLADAIRGDFKGMEEETEDLFSDELARLTGEHLKGGRVAIEPPPLEDDYSLWRSFWHWLKTNKLWALGFIFSMTCFVGWANIPLFLTMGFAMAAGWGRKTRAVISWASLAVGWAIYLPFLFWAFDIYVPG